MLKRLKEDRIYFDRDHLYKYEGEPYTGLGYLIDKSSQVIGEYAYCEGMQWGFSREWYSNGQLKKVYKYEYGCVYDWSYQWYSNGQLKQESFTSRDVGIVIKRKKWNDKGDLIDYFDLENDPESNLERYEEWISHKSIREKAVKNGTPPLVSPEWSLIMQKGSEFEKEIAKYLIAYPPSNAYYEKDFLNDFQGDSG